MTLTEVYNILNSREGMMIQSLACEKINNYDYNKSLNILRKNLEEDDFSETLFEGDATFFSQFTQNLIILYLTENNLYFSAYIEAWCLLVQNAIANNCFLNIGENHVLNNTIEAAVQLLTIKNTFTKLCVMSDFVFSKYENLFGKEKIRNTYAKDFISAVLEE